MSLRAIAAMKRENREMAEQLTSLKKVVHVQTLSSWSGIGQRVRDEISTARTLGYDVEASVNAETVTLTAVKRQYV